ncbi:hypothetical protein SSPIM334S_02371 [Streptomyces spiroverticillatus]|nr:hypothetical protein [Streptomyces finlayi]
MRPSSDIYQQLITTSHDVVCEVSAWMGPGEYTPYRLLAARVPVTSGTIQYDDTATLRRRLNITVPIRDPENATNWDPQGDPAHPLAVFGQQLNVRIGLTLPNGEVELFNHGWYLISEWSVDELERTVSVTAVDVAQRIVDERLMIARGPWSTAKTYAAEFRLMASVVRTDPYVDPRLSITKKVNPATIWERDRAKNLDDLCTAWPGRWFIDDEGRPHAAPPLPEVTPTTRPDVDLVSGARGTVVNRARTGTRERLYNTVVAIGKTGDELSSRPPWVSKSIETPGSPIHPQGPYGYKPRFYQSDLLTTSKQCMDAAKALLPKVAAIGRTEPINVLPDYRVELGDVARVRTDGGDFTGHVTAITLPLTADGGHMQVTLANVPDTPEEN